MISIEMECELQVSNQVPESRVRVDHFEWVPKRRDDKCALLAPAVLEKRVEVLTDLRKFSGL